MMSLDDVPSDELEREALELLSQATALVEKSYPLLKELNNVSLMPSQRMDLHKTLVALQSQHHQMYTEFMLRHVEVQRRKFS